MTIFSLLLWVFGSSLALCVIVVAFMRIIPESAAVKISKRVEGISSLVVLVFGTAATLSAAIATVSIGNLSSDIADRQNRRDAYVRMQSSADAINGNYSNVLISLSRLLVAGFEIQGTMKYYNEISRSRLNSLVEELPGGELRRVVNSFIETLRDLDQVLHKLQLNPSAARLLDQQLKEMEKNKSALQYIVDRTDKPALEPSAKLNITTLRYLLHNCQEILTSAPRKRLLEAYGSMLAHGGYPDGELSGPTTSVAFTGYLIELRREDRSDGKIRITSIGLAMLHDLLFLLPDEQTVISYLRENLNDEKTEVIYHFTPEVILGPTMAKGMNELSDHLGLVLFEM